MARSRRYEPTILDDLFGLLVTVPVWVGPILTAIVFVVSRWVFPLAMSAIGGDNAAAESITRMLAGLAVQLAPLFGAFVLLVWVVAEGKKWSSRRRLERQSGAGSVNALDWREFESLLTEAFRRQGFQTEHSGRNGPDGGVDIRLNKAGGVTLVQCKHWKRRQVGVQIVRELLGVVSSEGAHSGIVVTSGEFTPDAVAFAAKNPIRLVNGCELIEMLGAVQSSCRINLGVKASTTPDQSAGVSHANASERMCPKCGAAMTKRVAKSGQYAGTQFLGCTRYPQCRGILNLAPTEM
jgi:restriction system protein